MKKSMRPRPFPKLFLLLFCAGFGLALAGFAYTGYFMRLWADDYCYTAVLNQDGFWKAQVTFYLYTSDRYSVIPLVGISEWFGPGAVRFWPLAAVLSGVSVAAWAIRQAARRWGWEDAWLPALAGAEVLMFFTFWQAPNLFQALYWRTGMLTYFMPLVFQTLLAGLVLRWGQDARAAGWKTGIAAALAFGAGGFSETTAALQLGAVMLALAGAWAERRAGGRSSALQLLLAALVGTALAMVVLFVSPSNSLRLTHFEKQAGLVEIVSLSLRFALDFIIDTVKTQPLPTGVAVLAGLALGMAAGAARGELDGPQAAGVERRARWWAARVTAIFGAMYLLLACVMAPSVYVQVAYPEQRALIAARWVMTAGLVGPAWLTGRFALGWAQARLWGRLPGVLLFLTAALLVVASLYPVRAAALIYAEVPAHQQRAAAWDARDRAIRAQRAAGEQDITVAALDSVAGLMELLPDSTVWPNTCVAGAYQVRSITGYYP